MIRFRLGECQLAPLYNADMRQGEALVLNLPVTLVLAVALPVTPTFQTNFPYDKSHFLNHQFDRSHSTYVNVSTQT